MKKVFLIFVFMLFMPLAYSEETPVFTLDRDFVIPGMPASWNQGYAPSVQGDVMTIYLPVRSETETGRIEATVIVPDGAPNPFSGAGLVSSFYKGNDGVWRIVLKPKLHKLFVNGDYEIAIRIKGASGETVLPMAFQIRSGRAPEETLKPTLSDISSDLPLGSNGEIRFTLTNESRYAAFTDVTVTIQDASGDILPYPTNVHPLSSVAPDSSIPVVIPVNVRADASVSLHAVTLDIAYTALDAQHTHQEIIPLPVQDQIRMEMGEIELAPSLIQGDMGYVNVPVMNLGRANLTNTSVKLVLPGITEGRTFLIGTIEPGKTGSAKITFTPPKSVEGEVKGHIEVQTEDTWGNRASDLREISITIEKAKELPLTQMNTGGEKTNTPPFLLIGLLCACLILVFAFMIQGAYYKKRIRKLEEDRL